MPMLRLFARRAAIGLLALLPLPAIAAVEIEEVTSPGGIDAWLVEEPSIPFVALEIRFMGGAVLDPEPQAGATYLMAALLEEGAGERDAMSYSTARESLAASISFDAGADSVSVSGRFLSENREDAAALMRDALTEPRFDEDAIERVRAQIIARIRSNRTDPQEIASRAFSEATFGDHPYSRPIRGTEESVSALTRDDVVAAHDRALARDRIVAAAVGDIDAEALGQLLDAILGDLPEEGAPLPEPAEVELDGDVIVEPFDTPQSVIAFGHEGLARDDEDYVTAFVINEILGGRGFDTRLMQEIRVERGLTYGVYSYLVPRALGATYQGQVATANETAEEVIEAVRAEWTQMAEEGPTEEELAAAKTYLTGAYPLRFDGNATIAGILVGMQIADLSPDYVNERNALVEAITPEEAARVAARILQPEALSFVVVGRPEGLGASLEDAALRDTAPSAD